MIFNSLEFAAFFIMVTVAFFLLPHRYRWFLLLAASCYFYMAFVPVYILILGFTIVIDYYAGIWLEKATVRKKSILAISLAANIGILVFFKYFNFLNENLTALFRLAGAENPVPFLTILLPIGLSFHTFQAMSYTIEVYRGNQKAEHNFGIYALYVMFYPQLVAGPIERPQNILHQFYVEQQFDEKRVTSGLRLMLFGFVKKLVIADRISIYVDTVYGSANQQSGITLLVATLLFAIQIYCDFSGYSSIAIGSARVMGFDLMKNFNHPYLSQSVSEFWRRWHISLSTWFRDYVFIPLGGSRVARPRVYFNVLVVFLLSGIWHGASWTFVIWGLLNGLYLIIENALGIRSKSSNKLVALVRMIMTFLLVSFAWIFFRASNVEQGFLIVKRIFQFNGPLYMGYPKDHFYYAVLASFGLLAWELSREYGVSWVGSFERNPQPLKYAFYLAAIVTILLFGVFDGGQFIYFQF